MHLGVYQKERESQNWVFWSYGLSVKCFAEAVSKIFMPTFDASDFFTNFLKPFCEQQFQFLSKTSFIVVGFIFRLYEYQNVAKVISKTFMPTLIEYTSKFL